MGKGNYDGGSSTIVVNNSSEGKKDTRKKSQICLPKKLSKKKLNIKIRIGRGKRNKSSKKGTYSKEPRIVDDDKMAKDQTEMKDV